MNDSTRTHAHPKDALTLSPKYTSTRLERRRAALEIGSHALTGVGRPLHPDMTFSEDVFSKKARVMIWIIVALLCFVLTSVHFTLPVQLVLSVASGAGSVWGLKKLCAREFNRRKSLQAELWRTHPEYMRQLLYDYHSRGIGNPAILRQQTFRFTLIGLCTLIALAAIFAVFGISPLIHSTMLVFMATSLGLCALTMFPAAHVLASAEVEYEHEQLVSLAPELFTDEALKGAMSIDQDTMGGALSHAESPSTQPPSGFSLRGLPRMS